jgi:hypothetical protein
VGTKLNTDHFLLCVKLQFPPRRNNSNNCNKTNRRNNQLPQIKYKNRVNKDDSIKWIYRRRNEEYLKDITESTNVKQNLINRVANESLEK